MKFSIIIPVYKVEPYIQKCIAHVLNQSFADWELILVDDGSPDGCPQLCDEYANKDSRIKVIHKSNGGSSSARNAGLDVACGEYILFLDSDDYWCDNGLLKGLNDRSNMFNEDMILFGCKILHEDGTEEVTRGSYDLDILNEHDKAKALDRLYATGNMPGAAWIYCLKRAVVEQYGMRFTVGVTAEDYEWIISSVVHANAIGAIEGVQYAYIKHSGSITSMVKISAIKGTACALDRYRNIGSRYAALSKFCARIYLLALKAYNNLSDEDRIEAGPLLNAYVGALKEADMWAQFLFVKVMRLRISSKAINIAYSLIRK